MQLKESGIPLTIVIQNLSSTGKDWNPVLGNRNPLLRIQNPQRPCWLLKGKSGVRWGLGGGGGGWGVGGWWKLACFLKPCLCSYMWRSYPTHTWNSHLKQTVLERRDCDNLSLITIPNLELKSLPERELKARRTEIIPALLCFKKKRKKKTFVKARAYKCFINYFVGTLPVINHRPTLFGEFKNYENISMNKSITSIK